MDKFKKKMSTGEPSTLENHRIMAIAVFGKDSKAIKYLDDQIKKSPRGEKEEVVMSESQLVYLLGKIHSGEVKYESDH